ncbi:MAG: hypothetical protein RBT74_02805 [Tenuifilaceae bacterium]|jgi:hypothetical protein|nr:hypothetical protein [Tenuifilaceae bacterium]
MKPQKLYTPLLALLLALCLTECDKITTEADYKGVSLYRTKGDYFENVVIWMNKDGKIAGKPGFPLSNLYITEDDTINRFRSRIVDDYVLDGEGTLREAYLSVSYKEYLLWLERYDELTFPDDTIWKYMLDLDPYLELWRAKDNEAFLGYTVSSKLDTVGLKQIILNGRIEEYFTRLK